MRSAAQEFVVGGYTDPQGSRQGFGALLLGYYDADGQLTYAGKVGTGFTDSVLRQLHEAMSRLERDSPAFDRGKLPRSRVHWVEPRLVAEVGFSEWTTDGELRHPRYQGLREYGGRCAPAGLGADLTPARGHRRVTDALVAA